MAILHNYLRYVIAASLTVFALAAAEHHGQVKFGGLPLPGATVTAVQGEKKLDAVTDQQGAYTFPDLPDGVWSIQVEMLCFSPLKREVTIAPGASPEADWELKLLPIDEIKAAAGPARPAPPAPAAQVSAAPARPTRNKKAAPAATKQAGFQRTDLNASNASATNPPAESAVPQNESFGNQGASDLNQRAADGFLVNGSVNNGAVSPFAQSPAFGNNRKGGRPLYNGMLGLTVDNSELDARAFSLTGQDTPKPAYSHLTGFASVGGPLKLPRLPNWNANPPRFFLGYQWTRNLNASTQSSLMPTLLERNGDFSQGLVRTIFDPASGLPFPGNVIPQSRISPQASALLNFYPLPNFAGSSRYNYQIPLVGATHQDGVQSRVDKMLSRKNQISGAFNYQSTRADSTNQFGFLDTTGMTGINTNATWRHTFATRLFGTFTYQFSRFALRSTPYFANRENVSVQAGITGNNQDPLNWGPPSLNFSRGIAGLSDAKQSLTRNQTGALSASGLWIRGPHNVSFGGDWRKLQFNLLSQQDARGSFTFTGASTQASVNGVPMAGTGSDFAGFLLGIPDTSSIAFGNADKYLRASSYDAYVTDDWRISPGLTLNAGVRWEYSAPITELFGRLVNLDIASGFVAEAPVVAARPAGSLTGQRYSDSLVQPDKHGVGPRVGISWRPIPASSMVVRAGYGVYYNTSFYESIATQMAQQSPLSKSLSVQNSPADPLTLANGFTATAATTPNTFAVDPNFRVGYAQNWQISVQRDLPASLMMTATYLGIKGTRGMQEFLPNTYPAGAANPCAVCAAGYAYLTSNGNSTRESGQVQLRRRLHNGLTASVQYTFSKSIDDAALGGRNQSGSVIAQNWLNLSAERGLSSFDQRHLLNVQFQYTTGMGIGGGTLVSGWRGALLKEWVFDTQITAGSGLPLSPVYIAAVRGTGVTGSIRPDYTGAPVYAAPVGLSLNPAAYTAPAPGEWGNADRNSITGPGQFTLNGSMGRTFRVGDRLNFVLTN